MRGKGGLNHIDLPGNRSECKNTDLSGEKICLGIFPWKRKYVDFMSGVEKAHVLMSYAVLAYNRCGSIV
jgi:hypothetical protein